MDVDDRISRFIENLPILTINDLPEEQDCCPICFLEFSECCTEDETGFSKGVALLACGHAFCVNDLIEWINSKHGTCPTCRHIYLDIHPPSDSDDESDGGEYIPNDDESVYEDMQLDLTSEVDGLEEMDDLEQYMVWEGQRYADVEWDGAEESEFYSEDEFSVDASDGVLEILNERELDITLRGEGSDGLERSMSDSDSPKNPSAFEDGHDL